MPGASKGLNIILEPVLQDQSRKNALIFLPQSLPVSYSLDFRVVDALLCDFEDWKKPTAEIEFSP